MTLLSDGRYELGEFLAEGGMQKVYNALDLTLNRRVVVKTPKPGEVVKKFSDSARISSRINHHNVARTLDHFEENETSYLVEELVEGGTLEEACLVNGRFIDPHSGARLFAMLAKALEASHGVGVVHRDIKPSNILVEGGYAMDKVKVSDFGIATLTDAVFENEIAAKDITRTTNGTIKGALPYMAPEMLFRKKGDFIGAEADIWSLAAVMFRALTGNFPFGEDFEVPATIGTKGKISHIGWPAFLLEKAAYAPLSQELMSIVDSCFERNPSDRPTAVQLIEKLSALPYFKGTWRTGKINSIPAKFWGYVAFLNCNGEDVMCHVDSLYGANKFSLGQEVSFCSSPGNPHSRAFPIVLR
ncbi:serine/threonine-protein kinase [Paracoccus litorisediminis]|uniref:serine/threonine-protein kinase n=1 Tax=Paracoccus litorisediminis TaxID=2006130 RepID=UPI0037316DD0